MPQRQLHIAIGLLLFPVLVIGAPPGPRIDGTEFLVNTGSTSAEASDVTAAADGPFVIAWQSTPDTPAAFPQITARRYTASGAALGDEFRGDSSRTIAPVRLTIGTSTAQASIRNPADRSHRRTCGRRWCR